MNHDEKHKAICLFMPLIIFGCNAPIASKTLPAATTTAISVKNNHSTDKSLIYSKQDNDQESAEVPKIAGSELASQWVSSKDKAVNCRIKEWTSYPSGTNIKMEFANIASNKPVNIVYTLVVEDDKGGAIPIFNPYKSEQFNITDFKPLLGRGETKLIETEPKHVTAFSVKLKSCRTAIKHESYLTINPEMVDNGGP